MRVRDYKKEYRLSRQREMERQAKAEKVALASLNYIIEKKEWKQNDVATIFHEHGKILEAYKKALLGMWD